MVYDECKIYGPYTRKSDGRQIVVAVTYVEGKKVQSTVSYPKYLVEKSLGRYLDPDLETIDHKDNNFLNNDLENLRIISRKEHSKEDVIRVKSEQHVCAYCGKLFEISAYSLRQRLRGKSKYVFCSKSCVGNYGVIIQNGKKFVPKSEEVVLKKERFRLKNL